MTKVLIIGMSKILIACVRVYQMFVSPVLLALTGPSCRFSPSCSQYAIEAIGKHGPFRGSRYAIYRILRCQPFSKGGHDPVP